MEEEGRPNPDELLKAVKSEEQSAKRGRLKIFLGMAAGVGKTYAMLEDAHKVMGEGRKVMIGTVATHGRKETEALLEGLPVIPEKLMDYKGTTFQELDLEKVLELKPDLVVVDELAHSNIPGCRHPKRWQDVLEILDNGIDVATAVNVQHIESLKEIVETITNIPIRESVPDSVIENAASIEMVDLTPGDLLERLKEGKVYLGDQAAIARVNFFQVDRLTALREIALRFAAEKVDHDLRGMVSSVERANGWKPRERLLVAVSHSPHSQKLVRSTRRLAFALNAPWIAVHVQNGAILNAEDTQRLAKNLTLARDLGAEVITTQDPDIASAIERVARQKQATQIIVGRSPERTILGWWNQKTLVDTVASQCRDLDVHVIRQPASEASHRRDWHLALATGGAYFGIFCWVSLFTAASLVVEPYVGYKVVGFLFLLGISLLSLFYSKGPVFLGAVLYGAIWDYLFIPKTGALSVVHEEDGVLLALYVLTAIMTGILTDRARAREGMLAKREETSHALYEIVRLISSTPTSAEVVQAVKAHLEAVLDGTIDFILDRPEQGLTFEQPTEPKERATATWAFENVKEAGWSTDTLPASKNLYVPLKGYKDTVGVLSYYPSDNRVLTLQEKNFLSTAGQQLAYYLERRFSEERMRQTELLEQVEKIYGEVLNSLVGKVESTPETRAPWLKAAGRVTPEHLQTCNLRDLVESSVGKARQEHPLQEFTVTYSDHLPELRLDQRQIELLLGNLLAHACHASLSESPISVFVSSTEDTVSITMECRGLAPTNDVWALAVAKVIARAHKGSLVQEALRPDGMRFLLTLATTL